MRIKLILFWLLPIVAFSQEKATFSFQNKALTECLFFIENTYDVRFSYSNKLCENIRITFSEKPRTLTNVIDEIQEKTTIVIEKISNRYYILKRKHSSIQLLKEVTLNNYLTKGISKNKKGFFTIKPDELDILPGLIETDIMESIQQLPGVLSTSETATGLIVRGGSTDQNRIIWDGINIYHSGHLFGMISAFNPNISKKITFHNKGTNPRFGERVSSVIQIETNNNIEKETKASIGFNGINYDFVMATPLIKDKLSVQLSTRHSYTETIQTLTFDKLAKKIFQNTRIQSFKQNGNKFFFVDYNAKVNFILNKNNTFLVSGIFIENQLNYAIKNIETTITSNDVLKIKNSGLSLIWSKKWSKKLKQNTILSFSKYDLKYNLIESKEDVKLSDFDKQNIIYDTNFSTEFSWILNKIKQVNFGYQYVFNDVDYAFINTKSIQIILDSEKKRLGTHALFGNYSFKDFDLLNVDTGFRVNFYQQINKVKLEPRIVVYKNITSHLKAQITGEIKNQALSQIDETVLSDLSLENKLWHLADDKNFPIINSQQISAGLLYKNKSWSVDLDFYKKNMQGIAALSLGFLNPDGKTFHIGTKKNRGIDFYLKKKFAKFQIWTSYSYIDVLSKYKDLNNDKAFKANASITHAFSTSISYKVKKFQIALGWKWRTGMPYTKHYLENNKLTFKEINTGNLPNYHRLDLSTTYQFTMANNLKTKIGFSIKNIYNQNNQLSKEYSGYNNINDPIKVNDKYPLGFTPNFSCKIAF